MLFKYREGQQLIGDNHIIYTVIEYEKISDIGIPRFKLSFLNDKNKIETGFAMDTNTRLRPYYVEDGEITYV